MHTAAREDFLEAVLNLSQKRCQAVPLEEVIGVLDLDPDAAQEILERLAAEGSVLLRPDGTIELSTAGDETARRICRKHRVLECFLSEILGIDGRSASREACILEHKVSDETIERLSTSFGIRGRRGQRRRERCREPGDIRTLLDFEEGDRLEVKMVRGSGRAGRLTDLGILPGEYLEIRRKLPNDAVMVLVKGCDIALSPEIAGSIFVEKSE